MIKTPLMEHQEKIIEFIRDKEYSGIFAEYGTGKTLCMLKLAEDIGARKILVVCSKTAILATWPIELTKHTDFHYVYLLGTKQNRINALSFGLAKAREATTIYAQQFQRPVFFLINYDGIKSIYNELVASNFDVLVVDESTKIKYPSTQRTKILWALGKTVSRRFILTGFPITESPQDLYSQIKFLDGGKTFGNSYYGFMDKYFSKFGYKYVPKKDSTKDIIKAIEPFCIRVTNESLKLPPKRYFKHEIDPTDEQKKAFKEMKDFMQLEIGDVKIDSEYIFTRITKETEISDGFVKDGWHQKIGQYENEKKEKIKVYKCKKCNTESEFVNRIPPVSCPKCAYDGAYAIIPTNKDETLIDLLSEIDVEHHKVIIWTPFRFTIVKLKKLLEHHGINALMLTGDTDDVKSVVDKFMTGLKYNVLLATEKKAAESISLTNCRISIYYSNEWSYDRRANSEARIYRKGSEKHDSVIYIDFVTKGSIEETVYKCLRTKKNLVDELKALFGVSEANNEDRIEKS